MKNNHVILFSDTDDPACASAIKETALGLGCELDVKKKVSSAVRQLSGNEIIMVDMREAISSLREIKSYHPDAAVILLCQAEDIEAGFEEGAFSCLKKPVKKIPLGHALKNALKHRELLSRIDDLGAVRVPELALGRGGGMRQILAKIEKLSTASSPVLISGSEGTGRETVARVMHLKGPRRNSPFVTFSARHEAFGSEFFGSASAKAKALDAAGGTVFVKDIDKMPDDLGEKFAGFVSQGGLLLEGVGHVKTDVRVICSANGGSPVTSVASAFKSVIHLPELRHRPEDILPLAERFLEDASALFGGVPKKLSKDARRALKDHDWPGNVGELKNTVRRAYLLSKDETIESRHISFGDGSTCCSIREFLESKLSRFIKEMAKSNNTGLYGAVVTEVERALMDLVLTETQGNQVRASRVLGITRTTLRAKMKTFKAGK